jgi:hypothetical protein
VKLENFTAKEGEAPQKQDLEIDVGLVKAAVSSSSW